MNDNVLRRSEGEESVKKGSKSPVGTRNDKMINMLSNAFTSCMISLSTPACHSTR